MPRVYRYQPRGRAPFVWMPGFCCGLPMLGCCLLWALFCLVLLVSILGILRHLI